MWRMRVAAGRAGSPVGQWPVVVRGRRGGRDRDRVRSVGFNTRVPVVAGSGTGSYRGIAGDFTLAVTGNETLTSPGSCTEGPWTRLWEILVFAGPGTVS